MTTLKLSPDQIALARHALGLPNDRRRSYRNRFVAGPGHQDYDAWAAMARMGAANRDTRARGGGAMDLFWLTRAGAAAALQKGERLDPEDFPDE